MDKKANFCDSLKKSINTYSLHDDLNNLNHFYSEDLNNFGNVDYFGEVNNDDSNGNNFMNINHNNLNSGVNSLKSSNIFFG